jgi:hypothetical protein
MGTSLKSLDNFRSLVPVTIPARSLAPPCHGSTVKRHPKIFPNKLNSLICMFNISIS